MKSSPTRRVLKSIVGPALGMSLSALVATVPTACHKETKSSEQHPQPVGMVPPEPHPIPVVGKVEPPPGRTPDAGPVAVPGIPPSPPPPPPPGTVPPPPGMKPAPGFVASGRPQPVEIVRRGTRRATDFTVRARAVT